MKRRYDLCLVVEVVVVAVAVGNLTNPMWLSFRFALILTLHLPFLLLQRTPTYWLNFSLPPKSADVAGQKDMRGVNGKMQQQTDSGER